MSPEPESASTADPVSTRAAEGRGRPPRGESATDPSEAAARASVRALLGQFGTAVADAQTAVAPVAGPVFVPRPPKWRRVARPPGVALAALVSGLAAAVLIHWDRPGIGWFLAACVAATSVFLVDRNARKRVAATTKDVGGQKKSMPEQQADINSPRWKRYGGRPWWAALTLALLAVGAVRAAGWLFALCVVAACVAASLAVVGRRTVNGILYDTLAVWLETAAAVPWAYAGVARPRGGNATQAWRLGLSVAVTVALLAVFMPLLGSADAMFAALLETVTPAVDVPTVLRWAALFAVGCLGALGALFVLAGPPPPATAAAGGRTLRRTEWALPVGALAILFAAFVATQFVVLFGGDDYVQETSGLTYAEYARSGFWQLSAVTVLTLAVLMVVLRWAAQDTVADRWWLRGLLTAVSGLALVIVASALGRMWTYQQAYGFTVLRLLVEACELWLGSVYLLVLVAVLRLRRAWLPRAVLGTAMVTLLALAVLDPERLIAQQNIDRWQRGKALDIDYLGTLSPDVLPATDRLPEPLRSDLRSRLRADLDEDTWQSWNLSRAAAR
ncbi:hypothetical protein IFM12275_18180 [Nocardia sputorum]|uniref:DUF4153 domain-containing protein n=1 Tax=Nocardia sputorum TaxID=2984338 RepID=UPI0024914380|nr:DUF4153 domain-containing protein [Nocardia sputorum]BDT91842.1 hypothetical protein IFM12275_18180 [Nocardia sputorum]